MRELMYSPISRRMGASRAAVPSGTPAPKSVLVAMAMVSPIMSRATSRVSAGCHVETSRCASATMVSA